MYTNRKKEKRERESVENKKALLFLVESRELISFHLKVHVYLRQKVLANMTFNKLLNQLVDSLAIS